MGETASTSSTSARRVRSWPSPVEVGETARPPRSPRRTRPRSSSPTPADVFALGSLLYELLTGRTPLDGGAPPSRVADLGVSRHLARALDAVVERSIDPDPWRRYASSADLLADVQRVLRGRPPTVARLSVWSRAAWGLRGHRAGIAAATLGAVVGTAFRARR